MSRKVDQNSAEGKALQAEVQNKLKEYLGEEYNDDVLPLYIVVMLAHGNNEALVAENLQAFLGDPHAANFAAWLFQLLTGHQEWYTVPLQSTDDEPAVPVPTSTGPAPETTEKPSRKERTRDKIEWKEEKAAAAVLRGRGDERERQDRDRGRDRDVAKAYAAEEQHQRDGTDRERRRREREARHSDSARELKGGVGRHEERERRSERDHRDREKPREYEHERERERTRTRDQRDRLRAIPHAAEPGYERPSRHAEQDYPQDTRRGSPLRMASRSRWGHDLDADEFDEPVASPQERRRTDASRAMRSSPRRAPVDGMRSSALPAPPPEPPRQSILSRLDKRPRMDEEEPEPAPKRAAAPASVFDRLQGVKGPVPRPAAVANGVQDMEDEGEEDAPKKSVFARVARAPKPAAPAALNPNAPAFVPANGKAAENCEAPVVDDQAAIKAQLEEMRAQLQALQQQQVAALAARDNRCVVVNFLDPRVTPEILTAHFGGAGLPIVAVDIQRDGFGQSTGTAHLELASELAAQTALALSGSRLLDRPISVLPKTGPKVSYGGVSPSLSAVPGVFSPSLPGLPMPGNSPFVRPPRPLLPPMGRCHPPPSSGSVPFGGRMGPSGGRGRGRSAPLVTNKYIRPELREAMARRRAEDKEAVVEQLNTDLDRVKATSKADVVIV